MYMLVSFDGVRNIEFHSLFLILHCYLSFNISYMISEPLDLI